MIAFSPDNLQVAYGTPSGAVRIWNAESGKLSFTFLPKCAKGQECFHCYELEWRLDQIIFSRAGHYIAFSSEDGDIRILNTASGTRVATLRGDMPSVSTTLTFSSDASLLVSGTDDGIVRMWDVISGGLLSSLPGSGSPVASIAFEPDGNCIRVWFADATLRIWDPVCGSSTPQAPSLAALPASNFLPQFPQDKDMVLFIQAWSQALGVPIFKPYGLGMRSMVFSPDRKAVVIGRGNGRIFLLKPPSICP